MKQKIRIITAKDVRKVNGELISGPRTTITKAPYKVMQIVRNAHFSSEEIERVGRKALSDVAAAA